MAEVSIEHAIAMAQEHARAGRFQLAQSIYEKILAIEPDNFSAIVNLGAALHAQGLYELAAEQYRRAIEFRPSEGRLWSSLGASLQELGRFDEVFAALERAIQLVPEYAEAHANLANVLQHTGRACESLPLYRRALQIRPDLAAAHSNLCFAMHFCADVTPAELLAEHRRWAERHASAITPMSHSRDRQQGARLRVGYVSPDFRTHPVGRFLLALFEHHDRAKFEVVGFSTVDRPDRITDRFRELADGWHEVAALSDGSLAELIDREEVDILIDLSLHSGQNRMLTFARKPAPVQVTYLAYPSTSGLSAMDFRLTDAFLDPPSEDANYVERSVRLNCYWCYRPLGAEPDVAPLPSAARGFITFASLSNFAKISDAALTIWKQVLDATPKSGLILAALPGTHRRRATDVLGDRVTFVETTSFENYLAHYAQIDIALDPFPYCGGTTTCDALYMGVPVVTLAGKTAVGRGGVSILNQIGQQECIATTPEQYVQIATALAKDIPKLAMLRSELRTRMTSSPLCDAAAFTRDFEAKLRWMWEHATITSDGAANH